MIQGQLEAHWWFLEWPPVCQTLYLSRHLWCSMYNFCDLNMRQFKVIQGQGTWCQSTAQEWFRIRLPLIASWYLPSFSTYLTLKLFFHGNIVKIYPTFGLADMRPSDFHRNSRWPHLPEPYLDGKFGEDRWMIVICRAFNSFRVTDSLTDTQTNWFYNLSNAGQIKTKS